MRMESVVLGAPTLRWYEVRKGHYLFQTGDLFHFLFWQAVNF